MKKANCGKIVCNLNWLTKRVVITNGHYVHTHQPLFAGLTVVLFQGQKLRFDFCAMSTCMQVSMVYCCFCLMKWIWFFSFWVIL